MRERDWLRIGKVVAPQGLKGELRVYPHSDFPERFRTPGTRWLQLPGGDEPHPVELEWGRPLPGKGLYAVKLASIADRDAAEAARGSKLLVPAGHRPELAEGEHHVADLVGLRVRHHRTGEMLGTVTDFFVVGNELLQVRLAQPAATVQRAQPTRTVLVPFVHAIVPTVDAAGGYLTVDPPPGLLDADWG